MLSDFERMLRRERIRFLKRKKAAFTEKLAEHENKAGRDLSDSDPYCEEIQAEITATEAELKALQDLDPFQDTERG